MPRCGPPPVPDERFLATAERYGYWNATPEENAEVGLASADLFGAGYRVSPTGSTTVRPGPGGPPTP